MTEQQRVAIGFRPRTWSGWFFWLQVLVTACDLVGGEEDEVMSNNEFSVCQFFEDGQHRYTRRYVGVEEAMKAAIHYSTSVGAQIGMTVRVIITDGGDCIAWEWIRGQGVVFPPEAVRHV